MARVDSRQSTGSDAFQLTGLSGFLALQQLHAAGHEPLAFYLKGGADTPTPSFGRMFPRLDGGTDFDPRSDPRRPLCLRLS
ncbi:hypothetical protein GCM10010255_48790 [Streptomyces coeruleofuscus]|uniref:Uncharacterized protein n=1 Tax=Streptomyces coeruleofuscus TaxID=66879 RepID=A0ABN3IKV2_9ACTN